jgi:GH15 family glucan-1,4-alpha-glucosidase
VFKVQAVAKIQKSFIDIKDPLIIADLFSETVAGGSNTAAAVGNGKLTAGISPWGEIVYFRWPSPSHYDHLRYVTSYKHLIQGMLKVSDVRFGKDAPSIDWMRYGRPYEKHEGLGACGGIYIDGKVYWQDQPVWNSSRRYVPDDSHLLETSLKCNENCSVNNMKLTVKQWVMPRSDVLIQHYEIYTDRADSFFYHGVFAPWMTNPSTFHNPDSKKAGFGAFYSEKDQVMMWFYPHKTDRVILNQAMKKEISIKTCSDIVTGEGIYIAMASLQNIDQFQVGPGYKNCKASHNERGRFDAEDGSLECSTWQKGAADGAFKFNLEKGKGAVTILIAAGSTPAEAMVNIDRVKKRGLEGVITDALNFWNQDGRNIYIPPKAEASAAAVARRSILNLLIGQDAESGAIIASPTRQPCYSCDWPRDGAFYDMALDLAGSSEAVDRHLLFYKRTQRTETFAFNKTWLASFKSPWFNPRGHWYANMNCDGTPGFFRIIPFEIDETSLIVWDIWRHLQYIPSSLEEQYRETYKNTMLMAMDAIMPWVDVKKKWTRKIMEDDDYIAKATLHGTSAVLTALASGADLAHKWNLDLSLRDRWLEAAHALREGMLERINDPATLNEAGWRGIQWSLFPAPLFDEKNREKSRSLLEKLAADLYGKAVEKEGGVGYLGEQLFILAASTLHTDEYDSLKNQVLRVLIDDAPVQGSNCYGELGLWMEINNEKFIQNRTSIPHLWNGICAYLSVLAMHEPDKFQSLRPPLV